MPLALQFIPDSDWKTQCLWLPFSSSSFLSYYSGILPYL